MGTYGRDFAAVYDEKWASWSHRMWPCLQHAVARFKPDARTWLDLCCGSGALLGFVCRAGFEAVGVDASPHQLRHARRNAPAARLVRADVRDFALGRQFDVVTCLFDSLNYLTRKADLARAFRNARRHLADGGLFAFDMNTLEGLRTNWRRTTVLREPRLTLINETSFDERRSLGLCRVTGFVREGRRYRGFDETHVERGYTPEEIDGLLARARLAFAKYDGHSLGRARKRSARLFYICRKG